MTFRMLSDIIEARRYFRVSGVRATRIWFHALMKKECGKTHVTTRAVLKVTTARYRSCSLRPSLVWNILYIAKLVSGSLNLPPYNGWVNGVFMKGAQWRAGEPMLVHGWCFNSSRAVLTPSPLWWAHDKPKPWLEPRSRNFKYRKACISLGGRDQKTPFWYIIYLTSLLPVCYQDVRFHNLSFGCDLGTTGRGTNGNTSRCWQDAAWS